VAAETGSAPCAVNKAGRLLTKRLQEASMSAPCCRVPVPTCGVAKLWHYNTTVGAVVVDVGARQAGVGQTWHITLGNVLRLQWSKGSRQNTSTVLRLPVALSCQLL
jgi:hypothetical protein